MKKKLLTAVIGAALAASPLWALADTTLYGHFHESLDNQDTDSSPTVTNQTVQRGYVSSNSSRFGIKGDEDLGSGLKAIYQMESGVFDASNGNGGLGNTLRNTFVGMSDSLWGSVKVGRNDTPFKDLGRAIDPFNEEVGDARNITGCGSVSGPVSGSSGATTSSCEFDQRASNMIRYDSPDMSGFRVAALYGTGEITNQNLSTMAGSQAHIMSIAGNWDSGMGLMLGLGYERHDIQGPINNTAAYDSVQSGTTSNPKEDAWRGIGSYGFGNAKVFALYERDMDQYGVSGNNRNEWGAGATYTMGNNMLKLQYYKADSSSKFLAANGSTDNSGDMWAVGVDHNFSKTTLMYVNYAVAKNGAGTNAYDVVSSNGGHGDVLPVNNTGLPVNNTGASPKAYSLGMIINF